MCGWRVDMEHADLERVLDRLRELIRLHREDIAAAIPWTLNTDDRIHVVLASRAAVRLRIELLELSRDLHSAKRAMERAILGPQPLPIRRTLNGVSAKTKAVRTAFE